MLRNIDDLHGFTIGALDGEIGAVTDCYFDEVSYTVRYVVVDAGGLRVRRHERKERFTP